MSLKYEDLGLVIFKVRFPISMTTIVNRPASLWFSMLPRKAMTVSYLADTKGVVGCGYHRSLAGKVRLLIRF